MNSGLAAWRRPILIGGAITGVIFLLSVLDLVAGGHLTGKTRFHTLPGSRLFIGGDLSQSVRRPDDVRLGFDIPGLTLTVAEVKGRFWRGELQVPANAAAGVYTLREVTAVAAAPAIAPAWRVVVYPSASAMRADSPFLIRRVTGIAPWWFTIGSAPLLLAALALSFYIAGRRESTLADRGFLPIVRLVRRKDHWEVAAPLDQGSTIAAGHDLAVVDWRLAPVARMTVTGIENGLLLGRLPPATRVPPDGYVQRRPVQPSLNERDPA